MVIGAQRGDWYDKHTMIFACVTADDAGAAVSSFTVSADVLTLGRLIEVRHETAVELEVTHALSM